MTTTNDDGVSRKTKSSCKTAGRLATQAKLAGGLRLGRRVRAVSPLQKELPMQQDTTAAPSDVLPTPDADGSAANEPAAPMGGEQVTVEKVLVTVAMATDWLKANWNNRRVNRARVRMYARMMRDGLWKLNSQGIAFDRNGALVDGQHRLMAILESETPVLMLIVRGIDPEAVRTIDQGRSRTLAETLRREGQIPSPSQVTSWTSAVRMVTTGKNVPSSTLDVEEFYEANQAAIDWALTILPPKGPFRVSALWAAIVVAHCSDPGKTRAFAQRVIDGDQLSKNAPEFLVRDYIINNPSQGGSYAAQTSRRIFAAMALSFKGKTGTLLREGVQSTQLFVQPYLDSL